MTTITTIAIVIFIACFIVMAVIPTIIFIQILKLEKLRDKIEETEKLVPVKAYPNGSLKYSVEDIMNSANFKRHIESLRNAEEEVSRQISTTDKRK